MESMEKLFNWEELKDAGKLDEMFSKGTIAAGVELTRDPRFVWVGNWLMEMPHAKWLEHG